MATMDSLKKTLSYLRGRRKRYENRFEDDLKYSDTARKEKLKPLVLEQNDKVIALLEKMLDAVEDDADQAYVVTQMDDAEKFERKIKETFVAYCKRIQENLARGNQINRANDDDGGIEGNLEETAINVRTKSHVNNVHKKPVEMESDISLKDFEILKRKFSDYLVLTGLNEAQRGTQVATLRGFLSSDMYDKLRISVGVEDDTELNLEEILELIRKFIRLKRNIALDGVLFEQRKQLEGEDFETFPVQSQKSKDVSK